MRSARHLVGLIIAGWSFAAPFWINAHQHRRSYRSLIRWRLPFAPEPHLPPERFFGAIRAGLRRRALQSASTRHADRALLILLRCERLSGRASACRARPGSRAWAGAHGDFLGVIGAAAVGGALLLPSLKRRLGADGVVVAGTIGTAVAMALYGCHDTPGQPLPRA